MSRAGEIDKGDDVEVDEKRLRSTTDASVWAEEFAKVCPNVDQGLMIGWFANAIETTKMFTLAEELARQSSARCQPLWDAICAALDELGVPGPDYPAPVANAVAILRRAVGADSDIEEGDEFDGPICI